MTGAERKRAWRERQKLVINRSEVPVVEPRVSTFYIDLPAAMASIRKSLRTEVRLQHSLAADYELATTLPRVEKIFTYMSLRAILPTLADVKAYLGGKALPK